MNKHRYQKPQAVKDLERQALDHFRRDHPDFPEYAIPSQFYRDDTANGLTKCIVDYIRYNGGQAERINTMGHPVDTRKTFDVAGCQRQVGTLRWGKSTSTPGSADISATIAGHSVKVEVKIGHDRQSEAQRRYQVSIERAGGLYSLPKISQLSSSGTAKNSIGIAMENLEMIKLSKQQELARYRQRPDAKPYVINKLKEQIAALDNCVDLNDSKVDNQLLILLRDTLYKALYAEDPADVLIVGMRLTNHPEIERVDLADLVYSTKLDDPQTGLYELLEIGRCIRSDKAVARLTFRHILEGLDNFKV